MRICFSAMGSGFVNNGGSKTILSCANVLTELGHEVTVAADNYHFDWFPLKAKRIKKLPKKTDVLIATAVSTVEPILRHKIKAKKFWYVRGWENWATPENKIIELTKSINVIVNAKWLRKKIAKGGARKPPTVYPGLDLDTFYPEETETDGITIGGLYHPRKLKRFGMWHSIMKRVVAERKVKVNVFGTDPKPHLPFDFNYFRSPKPDLHRKMYNQCDIWLFSSENEGLHIPPMEAGLCNCALVGPDIGGVQDYAINGETALLGDKNRCVKNILKLIDDESLRKELSKNLRDHLLEHIGSREDNMKQMVKILSGLK